MILRPVRPQSPSGPPMMNRPVGLMRTSVLGVSSPAGSTAWMRSFLRISRISAVLIDAACCVDTTTAVISTGLSLTYRTDTWVLESGQRPTQLVGPVDRRRHQRVGLGDGVAEHEPLVAGALLGGGLVGGRC